MIRAEGVSVHFSRGLFRGVVRALDGLDLEIREGEFFALLGQNGAGKSTTMYCLLGLLQPTRGRITVLNREGLESASCECYARIREELEQSLNGARPPRSKSPRRTR